VDLMDREPSTPARRLKHCRILYRPWRVPTLISYPPPPPAKRDEPIIGFARPATPPERVTPPPVRSRSERRRRDCVFIPDMDIALQFIEARRQAAGLLGELELPPSSRRAARYEVPKHEITDSPVAIGVLMTVAPPLAITLVWSSSRFARTAQWALTAYGAIVTLVLAALAFAAFSS
jgi:hypothetical protein